MKKESRIYKMFSSLGIGFGFGLLITTFVAMCKGLFQFVSNYSQYRLKDVYYLYTDAMDEFQFPINKFTFIGFTIAILFYGIEVQRFWMRKSKTENI